MKNMDTNEDLKSKISFLISYLEERVETNEQMSYRLQDAYAQGFNYGEEMAYKSIANFLKTLKGDSQ
jgi:sensor c-di-GMP phosphodiesterase-like protein